VKNILLDTSHREGKGGSLSLQAKSCLFNIKEFPVLLNQSEKCIESSMNEEIDLLYNKQVVTLFCNCSIVKGKMYMYVAVSRATSVNHRQQHMHPPKFTTTAPAQAYSTCSPLE